MVTFPWRVVIQAMAAPAKIYNQETTAGNPLVRNAATFVYRNAQSTIVTMILSASSMRQVKAMMLRNPQVCTKACPPVVTGTVFPHSNGRHD